MQLESLKLFLLISISFIFTACASKPEAPLKRGPHVQQSFENTSADSKVLKANQDPTEASTPPPPEAANPELKSETNPDGGGPEIKTLPITFGVLLGPGGFKSYFAIGFLQELAKSQIPIKAVAGFELNALVAALYAHHGQAYEAEWQMMKLKESDFNHRTLFGRESLQSVTILDPILSSVFNTEVIEQSKVRFACATQKDTLQIVKDGNFVENLHKCIADQPFYETYQGYRAAPAKASVGALVATLKEMGATHIIYLDLNGEVSSQDASVFKLEHFPIIENNIADFAHRRDLLNKGREMGQKVVEEIQTELGL